jgi:RNA polymerase sigma-70 factor (TIGR02960 family)
MLAWGDVWVDTAPPRIGTPNGGACQHGSVRALDLEAAQWGDEQAFTRLIEPHRRELHVHCYRMLGSLDQADDMLQETLLAAWRGVGGFQARSSVRTWLYRIATTRCLNAIRDAARRPPVAPTPPFDAPEPSATFEVTWLQPYPDDLLDDLDPATRALARESTEIAFIAALQALPPRQTAALVLCDVLGFTQSEVAEMLHTQMTAVKGLLQRARATMPALHRVAPCAASDGLARQFADAFSRDDVAGLVTLLTDDAWLAMPPAPHLYLGPTAIGRFLHASATGRPGGPYHLVPVRAGGHNAFACYLEGWARGLLVPIPSADGTRISGIIRFLQDDLHHYFDLPPRLG